MSTNIQENTAAREGSRGAFIHSLATGTGVLLIVFVLLKPAVVRAQSSGSSLRFHGNGVNDIDRVKILIDDPATTNPGPPADVGATDFTLEFWMKARQTENSAGAVSCGLNYNWINGNIVFDRDRYNQNRTYGISIAGGVVVLGILGADNVPRTICGTTYVLDDQWHEIAIQRRRADGWMWLYVDGSLEAQADGPNGDISYPDDGVPGNYCGGPCNNSDPYLVIGAEKHDAGAAYPSYSGWIDEVRLSNMLRYSGNFTMPVQPFVTDANTVALYHFDEGSGDQINDSSNAPGGPSQGVRKYGGSPAGPEWSTDTPFTAGSAVSTLTRTGYLKSNQSKVFYHGGQWWAIAFFEPEARWYIWRYNGVSWTTERALRKGIASHYDAVVNSGTGKLYLFGSHHLNPQFCRYSYSGGTWRRDAGFPIWLLDFPNVDGSNPASLVQAKNGDLWIFRIDANTLQAKRSSDGGSTWSSRINIKTGLIAANGTTDAVAYTAGSNSYVGVAYGEPDTPGSRFGFVRHRDGDPGATWTDESSSLTFFSTERARNRLCMTAGASNNIYLFTHNSGVASGKPRNTLYKRTPTGTTGAGSWTKYKVNSGAGLNWKTPAIVIDEINEALYVIGVNTNSNQGEYKVCAIGQESTLETAPVNGLFAGPGATFDHLSVPAANVNSTTGLMICADNTAAGDIWYRQLTIGAGTSTTAGASSPASDGNTSGITSVHAKAAAVNGFNEFSVFPNPFNPDTFFRFTVGAPAPVQLQIFNLNGQLVRTLVDEELAAGVHQKRWNGRDKNGHAVASGTYLYRLQIGLNAKKGQLQLIK